jgi:hypothetical protein
MRCEPATGRKTSPRRRSPWPPTFGTWCRRCTCTPEAQRCYGRTKTAATPRPVRAASYTHAVYATCNRLLSVDRDIYAGSANQYPDDAQRWALATAGWGHLVKELKDRQLPGEFIVNAKDKAKLIALVTLPQLVCLAFLMRRRELRAMRATWQQLRADAVEKGHDPERHPDVVAAEDEYLVNAMRRTMLSITLDDGMRHKQYHADAWATSATSGRCGATMAVTSSVSKG